MISRKARGIQKKARTRNIFYKAKLQSLILLKV
jgi:hypothetical protein